MYINWQSKELNLKVVYYGPALSGKTTNLEQIHAHVPQKKRSDLISLKTSEDRTLYFDFLQLELGKISGLVPKIQLYTVPGQTYYEASRRLVLRGADGVVFVADSSASRLHDNIESWKNMQTHLASFPTPLTDIPVVVQYNKRDCSDALRLELLARMLSAEGKRFFPAVAFKGQGVLNTLKAITSEVMKSIQKSMV